MGSETPQRTAVTPSAQGDIRSARLAGAAFVVVSAVGFGALGIFGKVAFAAGASTAVVLFLRFLVAGVLMAALMGALRLPWPRGRDLWILGGMGAVGYVGQAFCYFSALRYASAGLTALLLYLYPALVTLASAALGRQRLTPLKVAAVAASLGGIILTVSDGLAGSPAGIAFGAGAAVIYTGYILVGERVSRRTGAIPAATVIMLAAAVVYGAAVAWEGARWPAGIAGWGAVAAIALFSTVVAMVGFFAGMQRLGAADASTLSTLEPVVTLLLAALFLGESLGATEMAGAVLVLGAVVALARAG
ncbi:DMT family transporter [Geobacter pickeringii]|uniref:DMT family transporter n=1 Tax=Geobacter pickeringii TaxID=345632 RepID=UPI0009FF6865|nr:DMT family transporter [Geobacter pickeringii]